jgi:O-acetyl-ADP-ribose deacetylase (regulator of RNase III)
MSNQVIAEKALPSGGVLRLVKGDITAEAVDAIVNAANSYLQHGGGVAAAIVRKGGPEIQSESNKIGFVPVGQAALTGAGKLPAKAVIHAVGPRWGEGDEDAKLASAVTSSLTLADQQHFASISMPAISSGIFGFPKERCAKVILQAIESFFRDHPNSRIKEVRLCLFDEETCKAFEAAF